MGLARSVRMRCDCPEGAGAYRLGRMANSPPWCARMFGFVVLLRILGPLRAFRSNNLVPLAYTGLRRQMSELEVRHGKAAVDRSASFDRALFRVSRAALTPSGLCVSIIFVPPRTDTDPATLARRAQLPGQLSFHRDCSILPTASFDTEHGLRSLVAGAR